MIVLGVFNNCYPLLSRRAQVAETFSSSHPTQAMIVIEVSNGWNVWSVQE